jgi:hypothetical protein
MDAKKQTAVEWFYRELFMPHPIEDLDTVLAKANEMFKQQIEQAFRDGFFDGCNPLIFKIDYEQYYKEKYESKTNI